jgi:predicted enzyme related to lactoylglutathione lyase
MEGSPPGFDYWTFQINGQPAAGINAMTDPPFQAEVPSHWTTYFCVDNTDSTVDAAVKRGATLLMPASDTPFGRMAMVADPWGAPFAVIQDQKSD